jgi:hypothetical protein
MSWRVEVIADASGRWYETMERFGTEGGGQRHATLWWGELTRIRQTRVTECEKPVTHVCAGFDVFGRVLAPISIVNIRSAA